MEQLVFSLFLLCNTKVPMLTSTLKINKNGHSYINFSDCFSKKINIPQSYYILGMVKISCCAPFSVKKPTTDITRTNFQLPFECSRELTWDQCQWYVIHRTMCFSILLPVEWVFCPLRIYQNYAIDTRSDVKCTQVMSVDKQTWQHTSAEQTEAAPSALKGNVLKTSVSIVYSIFFCHWEYERSCNTQF